MKPRNIIIFAILIGAFFWLIAQSNNKPQLTSQGQPVTATQTTGDLYKTAFVESCMAEGAGLGQYCRCVYNGIDAKYTLDEQTKLFDNYNKTETFPDNINDIVADCIYLVE